MCTSFTSSHVQCVIGVFGDGLARTGVMHTFSLVSGRLVQAHHTVSLLLRCLRHWVHPLCGHALSPHAWYSLSPVSVMSSDFALPQAQQQETAILGEAAELAKEAPAPRDALPEE